MQARSISGPVGSARIRGVYERLGLFGRLLYDLLEEVVLAGEVVADQAAADPQFPGYAGEGRSRKAGLGDGVYRRGHDLRPPEVSRWRRRSGVAVARTRRRRPTGRGGRCLARGWW
jgi:hypothetical protein